jgi:DNA uptake protein ComE-like DNA-binding protein
VAERERRPFADVADLERVAGIGPRTRMRMAPWLALPGGAAPRGNR